MRAAATLTPRRRESLRGMLLSAARCGRLDLGGPALPNWAAIDGFLLEADVSVDDLSALNRSDIEAVRTRLDQGPTLRERCEALIEWLDESGFASALLVVAIILALIWLWHVTLESAHAATPVTEPEPSNLGGLLIASVPFVIIALLLAAATRGEPRSADEEAYGDTTGFGEQER